MELAPSLSLGSGFMSGVVRMQCEVQLVSYSFDLLSDNYAVAGKSLLCDHLFGDFSVLPLFYIYIYIHTHI